MTEVSLTLTRAPHTPQGWDDAEVAAGYGNMSLFAQHLRLNRRALLYARRAEYLLTLAGGPQHPKLGALYLNIAMCHTDVGEVRTALRYLHAALTIFRRVLGEGHPSTARAYHQTALVLSLMRALPLAVKNEQSCLDILSSLHPAGDARVEESRQWLQHFTVLMSEDKAGRVVAASADRLPSAPEGTAARAEMSARASKALQPLVFSSGGEVRDGRELETEGRGGAGARGKGGVAGKGGRRRQAVQP